MLRAMTHRIGWYVHMTAELTYISREAGRMRHVVLCSAELVAAQWRQSSKQSGWFVITLAAFKLQNPLAGKSHMS